MILRRAVTFSVLSVLLLSCGKDENTVAEVGRERITGAEFAARYKEYLAAGAQRDNILLRTQILNNMINERLIYRDLSERGLDRDQTCQTKVAEVRNKALLIAYARNLVTDTSMIREEELHDEFRAYNSKVAARYLYARSLAGAQELKERIEHGETFEALAKDVFEDPGLANSGGSLGTFGWGEMEAALEGVAFSIPVGTVSDPVKLSMGYAIVRVDRRVGNQFVTEAEYLKVRDKLWRRVLERKIDVILQRELNRIQVDLAPSFNQAALSAVFKNWDNLTEERPPSEDKTSKLEDISAEELVHFKNGAWSVAEFAKKLEGTTDVQKRRVKAADDVKSVAIGLAAREVMLRRARQMGLESDSTVMAAVRHGREAFLLRRWLSSVTDTVGSSGWDEQLLRKAYEETKVERAYPPEVNVAEILVRSEADADRVARQVRRGADFGTLARKNSIRRWAAKHDGELGFGTEARFGQMGRRFFAAKIGDIIGPEKVDPYFAIFKILDRRDGKPMTFEDAKDQIIQELKQTREMEARKNALGGLRGGVSVSINNDLLAHIDVH